ncbi:hypothetical protein Tco_0864419 [Tanacetum coccineum]
MPSLVPDESEESSLLKMLYNLLLKNYRVPDIGAIRYPIYAIASREYESLNLLRGVGPAECEDECSGLFDESLDDDSDVVDGYKIDNGTARQRRNASLRLGALLGGIRRCELVEDGVVVLMNEVMHASSNMRAGKGPTLFLAVNNLRGPLRQVLVRSSKGNSLAGSDRIDDVDESEMGAVQEHRN